MWGKMNKTGNPNINTKEYWNMIYSDPVKKSNYMAQDTSETISEANYKIKPTMRFETALGQVNDGDKVLDIGCGVGKFCELVYSRKENVEVWGCDISDIAMYDNTVRFPQINYRHAIVGNLEGIPDDYFDVVFTGELLEHLDDPNDLIKDAHKKLKQGGKLILTTPLEDRINSPEHTYMFTHDDVKELFVKNGFTKTRFVYLPNNEHLLVIFCIGYKA